MTASAASSCSSVAYVDANARTRAEPRFGRSSVVLTALASTSISLGTRAGPGRGRLARFRTYPVVALKLAGKSSPFPKVEFSVAFVWGGNGTHVTLGGWPPLSLLIA